jgi:biopolymer transport protein ExbB
MTSQTGFWSNIVEETLGLWMSGGWLMIPLVFVACFIYWTAFDAFFYFSAHRFYKTSKERLVNWILNPILASGEIRSIIDYTQSEVVDTSDVRARFDEIQNAYLARLDRQRKFLYILIGVAPLMGLLGTVTGMLSTFRGLSTGSGTDTVDLIAGGISEALITTQTGLIIAIPAYIIASLVVKRRNEMESFLTAMETITVQMFEKKLKEVDET